MRLFRRVAPRLRCGPLVNHKGKKRVWSAAVVLRLSIAAALVASCSAEIHTPPPERPARPDPVPMTPAAPPAAPLAPPPPAGPDTPFPSMPPPDCAVVAARAQTRLAPADVVWVVDSSGSMENEAERVQANLNTFSAALDASGIDARMVMITDPDYVSVPPPLGDDPARYMFIDEGIGSHEALEALLEQLFLYRPFLRDDAVTHFIVVTDDESDLDATEFHSRMEGLLGRGFTFHSIASENDGGDACPGAAAIGREYDQLSGMTGGLFLSVCTEDWAMVFDSLREAITASSPLPCRYDLPEPPSGMIFDAMRVNVLYTPAGGTAETLPNVRTSDACGAGSTGWYYDDPTSPSEVILCPATCDRVNLAPDADLGITLGCTTVVI